MRPKRFKKFMAAVLSLAMTVTLIPGLAQTAEAAEPVPAAVAPGDTVTPEITWSRSEEAAISEDKTPASVGEIATGIQYRSNGQLVWNWNSIGDLKASETANVWDYNTNAQYSDLTKTGNALAATWVNWQKRTGQYNDYRRTENQTDVASARRFVGTFEWPEGYDVDDIGQLISVNDENYEGIYELAAEYQEFKDKTVLAINDDMYVFIHRADDTLTAANYMDYLAFWSGTSGKGRWSSYQEYSNTEPDSYNNTYATKAFYGYAPTIATESYNNTQLDSSITRNMNFSDKWYTFADTSGISSVLQKKYGDDGDITAGTKMMIEVFAFDYNGNGGMDQLEFSLTKRELEAQTVRVEYYVNTLNATGFLGATYMNNVTPGTQIKLSEGTDANQLNHMKLLAMKKDGNVKDGVQQGSVPYTVVENGNNVIQVLYTGSALSSASFVIDYGKDVNYTKEDVFGTGDNSELNNYEDYDISYQLKDAEGQLASSQKGTYGTMAVNSDGEDFLHYSLDSFMNGIDSYALDLELTDNSQTEAHVAKEVNMIPASSVYYEDDFTETTNTDSSVKIVYSNGWTQAGAAAANDTQSSENITYGYDESYADQLAASNGTVHSSTAGATASFKFTGTGTDIYSFTDNQSGTVMARLYQVGADGTETFREFAYCNNYAENGTYYTVPTVSFCDLEYGTYKVTLSVYASNKGSTYYLDGIRVYNPLGTVTDDKSAAGNAYKDAGELNAKYTELRSMLLDNMAETGGNGLLYIDSLDGDTSDISVYESNGPEHEIYLSKDSAVAFTLENFNPEQDAVYVGIKSAKGDQSLAAVTNGTTGQQKQIAVDSTMDQYYKITPDASGNVVIKNNGDGVIALTKVRTTSTQTNDIIFKSTNETLAAARAFALMPVSEETIEEPDSSETTVDEDEVVIENPDQEEDTENSGSADNTIQNIFENVFSSIFNWFWGRR